LQLVSFRRRINHAIPRRAHQIFSGVAGILISGEAPARANASATAFMSAGSDPVTPHSPEPLTPSGFFGDGTGWNSVVTDGMLSALGIA
jgi:hypothetical protein